MFSYIFVTNSVTQEITNSLELLHKTKHKNDKIILINYHQNHLEYRKESFGVDYRHIKSHRTDAINSVLPECGNVVIFQPKTYITKTFVRDISKFYDRHSFQTLRTDRSSKSGKFVESDYRIGSLIKPSSFTDSVIAFHTSIIPQIDENLMDTAKRAMENNISLRLLSNVKTLKTDKVTTKKAMVGITIIIPSRGYKLSDRIRESLSANDKIVEFDENPRVIRNIINKTALQSTNECILLISPHSNIFDNSIISRIRALYNNSKNILFDNSIDKLTDNAWLVTHKDNLSMLPRTLTSTVGIINYIVDKTPDIMKYNEVSETPTDRVKVSNTNNSISIIIPFKYDGDRWPLFEASIDNLYKQTRNYDNIEIVVHEASSKRHIPPDFVKKYNLVYLFSKYTETFHKSWVMNVACKYVATGDTFVFFDADMIVDHGWVIELLNSDKSKCMYGWGRIFNLTEEATKQYLKDGVIASGTVKISKPNIKTSAGGITLMPRHKFFKIGGWLESYKNLGYGGQDNSMAYKMTALGLYSSLDFKECTFISSIWHLFHGHQILKAPKRLEVHKSHSEYTAQDWYKHIEENHIWGEPTTGVNKESFDTYRNDGLIHALTKTNKINLTVCLVVDSNIGRLYNILKMLVDTKVAINLLLWVKNTDGVNPNVKQNIKSICQGFRRHRIQYSFHDHGVGYPMFMLTNQAVHEYRTPYVMVLNDSAIIEDAETLVLGSSVLRQDRYSDFGVVGICSGDTSDAMNVVGDKVNITLPTQGLNEVSIINPLAMTLRRDILKDITIDPNYKSNIMGFDICMAMKSKGYKVGMISDPVFDISRDSSTKPTKEIREGINDDVDRFRKMWGVDISDIYHLDIVTSKSNK